VGPCQFDIAVPQVLDSDLAPFSFTLGGVPGTKALCTAVNQQGELAIHEVTAGQINCLHHKPHHC
jgi:hypothetical protein